jgi:hypothetical protein
LASRPHLLFVLLLLLHLFCFLLPARLVHDVPLPIVHLQQLEQTAVATPATLRRPALGHSTAQRCERAHDPRIALAISSSCGFPAQTPSRFERPLMQDWSLS